MGIGLTFSSKLKDNTPNKSAVVVVDNKQILPCFIFALSRRLLQRRQQQAHLRLRSAKNHCNRKFEWGSFDDGINPRAPKLHPRATCSSLGENWSSLSA